MSLYIYIYNLQNVKKGMHHKPFLSLYPSFSKGDMIDLRTSLYSKFK